MSEWKTIDSAPKDGTKILVCHHGLINIAWWDEDASFGRFESKAGWQIVSCEDDFYSRATDEATHWMPLPEPPK